MDEKSLKFPQAKPGQKAITLLTQQNYLIYQQCLTLQFQTRHGIIAFKENRK